MILVEIDAYNKDTGLVETVYHADKSFLTSPTDDPANTRYRGGLISIEFSRHAKSGTGLVGPSDLDLGTLVLGNADQELDDYGKYAFDGRNVVVRYTEVADPAFSDFTVEITATIKDALIGTASGRFRLRDKRWRMNRPANRNRFTGQAMSLNMDGADAHIDLPIEASPIGETVWTIEGWFRAPRGLQSSSNGGMFQILYNSEDILVYTASDSASNQIGLTVIIGGVSHHYREINLADDYKHHLAIVKTATGLGRIYLDGIEVDDWTTSLITSGFAATLVRFGAHGTIATPAVFWQGDLWDWRFWDIERTKANIVEDFRSVLSGEETSLRAWYPMREGVDLTLGITSDPDGTGEFHNPGSREDFVTFDESLTPAGTGIALLNGNTTWVALLDSIDREGDIASLPVGDVYNYAPPLVVDDSQVYLVASTSVNRVKRVREGGRAIFSTGYLEFDGVDQIVTIPVISAYNLGSTGVATYEMIFQGTALNTGQLFDLSNGAFGPSFRVRVGDGGTTQGFDIIVADDGGASGGSGVLTASVVFTDNERHQISVTIDLPNLLIAAYFDGRLVGTEILTALTGTFDWDTPWELGREDFGDDFHFEGQMHQFRAWDSIRTGKEIHDNVLTDLVGNESNLIGYWDFDDGSGTTLTDKSSNANDGTLVNDPVWREKDYEIINSRRGAAIALKAPPSHPIRVDVDGWLPRGWGVQCATTPNVSAHVRVTHRDGLRIGGQHTVGLWVRWDPALICVTHALENFAKELTTAVEGSWVIQWASTNKFLDWFLETSSGLQNIATTWAPEDGDTWYFVTLVFDETLASLEQKVYIDAVLEAEENCPGTITNASSEDLFLWDRVEGGECSDFFILNRALSPDDIAKVMYKGVNPSDPDLLGRWFYDEDASNTSTTYKDSSANERGRLDGVTGHPDISRTPGPWPDTPSEVVTWMAGMDGKPGTPGSPVQDTAGPAIPADEFDAASIATFDTDSGAPVVGLVVRDHTVAQVIDAVLSPLGAWRMSLTGDLELYLARLPDVSGDASVATFTKSKQVSISVDRASLPSTEVSLLWSINEDPYSQNELVQAILDRPAEVKRLVNSGKTLERAIDGVEDVHLLAQPSPIIHTALVFLDDAKTNIEWVRGNRAIARVPYRVLLLGSHHTHLGKVVTLSEVSSGGVVPPRFNWDSDMIDGLVISAVVRLDAARINLTTTLVVLT